MPLQVRPQTKKRLNFENLELSQSSQNLPWYFSGLLEYFKLKNFSLNLSMLAEQLQTSKNEINQALENLKNLNYLTGSDKNLQVNLGMIRVFLNPPATNEIARHYQKKALEYSTKALENQNFSERIHNSAFFRFKKNQMPELRALTDKYIRDIIRLSKDQEDEADSVYCAQVSCFSLIKNEVPQP